MNSYTYLKEDLLSVVTDILGDFLAELSSVNGAPFPTSAVELNFGTDVAHTLTLPGSTAGSAVIRVAASMGWPAGRRFVVTIEARMSGYCVTSGLSGFLYKLSLLKTHKGVKHELNGYNNYHKTNGWQVLT